MKKVFTTKLNEKDVELFVTKPTAQIRVKAQLEFNKAWAEAEKNGSILRRNIDEIAERQGMWDQDKADKLKELENQIVVLEHKLMGGAHSFPTLDEAKKCALSIRKLRSDRSELLAIKNDLYSITADAHADNARMNFLVASCTRYNENDKSVFKDVNDFITHSDEPVVVDATSAYIELMFADLQNESNLYENVFMQKYGMMNEKNQLINDKGHLIDDNGKLINGEGRYVNEKGELVDIEGRRVDEKGKYIVDFAEWPTKPDQTAEPPKPKEDQPKNG